MNEKTKKLTMMAMIVAIGFLMVVLVHIPLMPAAPFLTYEPKDVILTIGGFLFGPLAACLMAIVTAFIELITISNTGLWGFLMNALSSVCFAGLAALIYKKKHTMKGAILGLVGGVCAMTVVMLLWNYFVTPIYMGYPRAAVAAMLVPVFLPFNLIKASINAAFTLLLYKPIVTALRKAGLLPKPEEASKAKGKINWGLMLAAVLVLATCIVAVLVMNGII